METMSAMDQLVFLLVFVFSAVWTSIVGWKRQGGDEPFDPVKFGTTVLTAFLLALVAIVLHYLGLIDTLSVTSAEQFLVALGLLGPFAMVVQFIVQWLYRRYKG